LGKITTGSQIVYIAQLLIIQAMNFDLHYIWLDWLVVFITALSLLVYAFNWFQSIKGHHEQT
jgi:uncharacterized protein (DUF983 family)